MSLRIPTHVLFSLLFLLAISTQVSSFSFLPFTTPSSVSQLHSQTHTVTIPHTADRSIPIAQQRGQSKNHRRSPNGEHVSVTVIKNGYLSSTKKQIEPHQFRHFSFARHPKDLPPWDPLQGVEGVLVHRSDPSTISASSSSVALAGTLVRSSLRPTDVQVQEDDDASDAEPEYLIERDGEVDAESFEDCEKREEGLTEPTPIAQLGNVPESQLQAGLQSLNVTTASVSDSIGGLPPGLGVLDESATNAGRTSSDLDVINDPSSGSDRKYGEKVLWSGLMNELEPLASGGSLIKRHRDKSGRHGDSWSGGADNGDYGSSGRSGRGRHGQGNGGGGGGYHGGYDGAGDENGEEGGYRRGQKHGGNGGGWHDSDDSVGGNGNGWHRGSSSSGNGGWKNGKGRPNWQNHQSGYHHPNDEGSDYNHGSAESGGHNRGGGYHASDTDDDRGKGWHHPSGYGDEGGGSRGKHAYDDGQYHPWKGNDNGGGNQGGWNDGGVHGASDGDEAASGSIMKGDEDWVASPLSYDNADDADSDNFSAQSSAANAKYAGGGAHRLAQTAYGTPARSDCSRLMQFYRASSRLSGGWVNDRGWVDENDEQCCEWFGVSCDPVSRRVTALELRNNGLTGGLSSYLFALNALMRVDLSQNSLIGFPDRFTLLPKLTHLNLSSSSLSGPIPPALLASPALVNLDLSKNNLTGHLEVSSGPNLRVVNVGDNQLEGIIVDSRSSSTADSGSGSALGSGLSKLVIANNRFEGPLPDLSRLESLSVFDASNNNTGTIFDLSTLNNLTRLDLRSNQLTGAFPSPLPPSLQSLYLSSNSLNGPIPQIAAPEPLTACYVLPNAFECPSEVELADQTSLASVCHLKNCAKLAAAASASAFASGTNQAQAQTSITGPTGAGVGTGKGIPVRPLPGEVMGLPASSSSSDSDGRVVSGDAWPGIQSPTQSQPSSSDGQSRQSQAGRPMNSNNMANGRVGSQASGSNLRSSARRERMVNAWESPMVVVGLTSLFLTFSLGIL